MTDESSFEARRRSSRMFSLVIGAVGGLAFAAELAVEFKDDRVVVLAVLGVMILLFSGAVHLWASVLPKVGKRTRILFLIGTEGLLYAVALALAANVATPSTNEGIRAATLSALFTAIALTAHIVHFDLIHLHRLDDPRGELPEA